MALAEKLGKPLDRLTLDEFRSVDARFGEDVTEVFHLGKAMQRRALVGAPGTREVRRQLARWKKLLG